MALTNAERQARHRERVSAKLEHYADLLSQNQKENCEMASTQRKTKTGDILDFAQTAPKKAPTKKAANSNKPAKVSADGIESSVEIIQPENAKWMRANAHFDRQRKISEANIKRLADEMTAGNFIPGTQIYLARLPDGSLLILNGNHTLEAVVASGVPMVATVTIKDVADIDEAGKIYAVFDIHKARSWLDSLRGVGLEDSVAMAPKVLGAISVIENKFAQSGQPPAASRLARFDKLAEYQESANLFARAISKAPGSKILQRSVVMGVALATFRDQPFSAAEFWRAVAMDDGLTAGRPEKALLSWLRNAPTGGGGTIRKETAKACALAWNAFFEDRTLTVCKPNASGSFHLSGTRWTAKHFAGLE